MDPTITLTLDEAEALFALATVTEDRSADAHMILVAFARRLDALGNDWHEECAQSTLKLESPQLGWTLDLLRTTKYAEYAERLFPEPR